MIEGLPPLEDNPEWLDLQNSRFNDSLIEAKAGILDALLKTDSVAVDAILPLSDAPGVVKSLDECDEHLNKALKILEGLDR